MLAPDLGQGLRYRQPSQGPALTELEIWGRSQAVIKAAYVCSVTIMTGAVDGVLRRGVEAGEGRVTKDKED